MTTTFNNFSVSLVARDWSGNISVDSTDPTGVAEEPTEPEVGTYFLASPDYVFIDDFTGALDATFWENGGVSRTYGADNPDGPGKCLLFSALAADGVSDGFNWTEQKFYPPGDYTQIEIRYDIWVSPGFHMESGGTSHQKFLLLWSGSYGTSASNCSINCEVWPDNHIGFNWGEDGNNYGHSKPVDAPETFLPNTEVGYWMNVHFLITLATAEGVKGRIIMMKDGEVYSDTATSTFDVENTGDVWATQPNYSDRGNFLDSGYLMGWQNQPYLVDTFFAVRNFEFRANTAHKAVDYSVIGESSGGSPITLLRVVDFNGLSNGQSVVDTVNDPGSTSGKRFDWTLGNKGFANGYGIQATTAVKEAGKTSSCLVSIASGSDGDPSGGDTGATYGCWGGALALGAHAVVEGEEIWYGMKVLIPSGYDWNHGSGASKPGYIKFMRVNNTSNGQRIEHHVINGSWDGDAAADNLQIGWTLANEFDAKAQSETHKKTEGIQTLDEWVWVEFYIYAHSNPALSKRRLWVNDSLVFERVGANNKWIDQSGDIQTEALASGEKSLPDSGAELDSVMHGTYWNGYAPQNQTYYIQHIGYHKDVNDLIATDQFGNKMIGSGAIV